MTKTLKDFLLLQGYIKVKLNFTKTNHFQIKASINNVKGHFILDTGASTSCVGFHTIDKFKLKVKDSDIKATGAGSGDIHTQISKKNTLTIGKWKSTKIGLIILDTTHINEALTSHGSSAVDGIIGGDLLRKGHGIIDYQKKYLYLKNC